MNKRLLFFPALACLCSTIAQPVFTSADNPKAGDAFTYYNCVVSSPGAAGADVTWDFSNASPGFTYSGRYDLCSGSPDCATFPGSNMVLKYPSLNTEKFFILDTNRYAINGYKIPGNNHVYSKAFDYIRYPFHYTDTYTDNFAATFTYNGIPYLERGYFTNTYDGWGTLKLPTGIFTNVMRMQQAEVYYDSALSGATITRDSIVQYSWYAPGYREYLFSYSKTYRNGTLSYTTISYSSQSPLSVTSINNIIVNLTVYPNPVQDELHIAFNMERTEIVYIALYDMAGKELAVMDNKMYSAGQQDLSCKMPRLTSGLYLLRLTSSSGSVSKKIEVW